MNRFQPHFKQLRLKELIGLNAELPRDLGYATQGGERGRGGEGVVHWELDIFTP